MNSIKNKAFIYLILVVSFAICAYESANAGAITPICYYLGSLMCLLWLFEQIHWALSTVSAPTPSAPPGFVSIGPSLPNSPPMTTLTITKAGQGAMSAESSMQILGVVDGITYYWAEPGKFLTPGVHYWDGTHNVPLRGQLMAVTPPPPEL